MKKIILIAFLTLTTLSAQAVILEAKPVSDLITSIQSAQFKYKETGMIFGYTTIQSCLYVSKDFAILKNYCFPKKDYPAQAYTIISPKFGMIDLYQEDLVSVLKRDIQITEFPDILKDYVKVPLNNSNIEGLNKIIEKLYYQYGPACWSTNASYSDQQPDVRCSTTEVIDFDLWKVETQNITSDLKSWKNLMQAVEAAITKTKLQ
ncbi:MAG: hypothetical protein ABL930_06185 [Pseudobdellovibrio sp.]